MLSRELIAKAQKLWFIRGWSEQQVYEDLGRNRFLPQKELSNVLNQYSPPQASQLDELRNFLKSKQTEEPAAQEFKHMWFVDDTYMEMVSFTFLGKTQKQS